MKAKILLVEDDESFRRVVGESLAKDYNVIAVENGRKAKELLTLENFQLVISDIQMPHFTGVELLEWIKTNKPCPVILMTGFSHLLESKQAVELGVDDFLAKPFASTDLMAKIEAILGPVNTDLPEEKKNNPPRVNFFRVPIEDFVSKKEIACAVYIQLNKEKYVKIAHRGGKIPEEKIVLFKQKGINHLYVDRVDFPAIIGFSVQLTKAMANNTSIDAAKKSRFFKYTGELLSQQIFDDSLDQEACNFAGDFIRSSLDLVTQDEHAGVLLLGLNEHADFLYAHSLGVSAISVMIAKNMGIESPSLLFKIAYAGLFHDIGKKELPRELLEKPRFQLTSEERKLYESHTVRGKEILESLDNAPSEAVAVAFEHHENCLSNGYPRGVDQTRIHPFSRIINAADVFCNYAIKNNIDHKALSPIEALVKMESNKAFEIDKTAFKALAGLVNKKAA